MIWYPLKNETAADRFIAAVTGQSGLEFLDVRLSVCAAFAGLGLTAAGVLVLNPPYVLREELEAIMPVLSERLAEGAGHGYRLRNVRS